MKQINNNKTIVSIVGIRPDFIRMSSVFKLLDKNFNHILIHTGQHFDKNLSDILALEKLNKSDKLIKDCYRIESFMYNVLIKCLESKMLFQEEIIGLLLKTLVIIFDNKNRLASVVSRFFYLTTFDSNILYISILINQN